MELGRWLSDCNVCWENMRTQVRSPEPMSSPGVMACFCDPGTGGVKKKDSWDMWPVSSKLGERPVSEIKVEDNWRRIPLMYLHTHTHYV